MRGATSGPEDVNGDGLLDGGDTLIDSTTTASGTGAYSFADLGPGNYIVAEVLEAGWAQTVPPAPGTYAVTGASGEDVTGQDFGNFERFGISGRKFKDLNGDGDDESGGDPGFSVFFAAWPGQ